MYVTDEEHKIPWGLAAHAGAGAAAETFAVYTAEGSTATLTEAFLETVGGAAFWIETVLWIALDSEWTLADEDVRNPLRGCGEQCAECAQQQVSAECTVHSRQFPKSHQCPSSHRWYDQ